MHRDDSAITTDLVLIGGGHSHLFVLKHLAMRPQPGVRVSLITRDLHTPYSGMLPGYIAGHYDYDDAHIDLRPLAQFAGVRLIHAEVESIDTQNQLIGISGRPAMEYDLLSINIGSRPCSPIIDPAGAVEFAVKPIDRFIDAWRGLEQRLMENPEALDLAIIGAGAGGVELALSLDYRCRRLPPGSGRLNIVLVTDSSCILPTHNRRVQRIFERILAQRAIVVHYRSRIEDYDGKQLCGDLAAPIAADAAIWVTQASAAAWLTDSGLALDDQGFIAVNSCMQSSSHDNVFAAGDIASMTQFPRAKSGVFAVRQGLPLARNLVRHLQGRKPRPFHPQRQFLSLISSGDRYAVASRGAWALQGRWCWLLKDWIDRRFIRRFSRLPARPIADASTMAADLKPMHCGGCGSKVGSRVLQRVLDQIAPHDSASTTAGLRKIEDAAVLQPPPDQQLIQSVDHFRSFIDDPYLFGRIAANHALGDLFAMGVDAHSAMVIAAVAYGSEDKQSQDLFQLMAGVVETLRQHDTRLLGGHSGEASEMSCGLSVNGFAQADQLMHKGGMRIGDVLILTKAVGSGLLFAADMRGMARGRWIADALRQMLQSSRAASRCMRDFEASACTDVTGFGLAGHLYEMANASNCSVEIFLERLPLFEGAAELAQRGLESSLQAQNIRIRHALGDPDGLAGHAHYPLLFDPQTAGGLLASIPAGQVDACLGRLHSEGYADACAIGRVIKAVTPAESMRLRRV